MPSGWGLTNRMYRIVVHLDIPGSLEEYFQEAGRAGRDSRKAFAVALCTDTDSFHLKKRIDDEFPEKKLIGKVYEALGDYFRIQEGQGKDIVHNFELTDFYSTCQLPPLQIHHALKLLELSGYIEYCEAWTNHPSRPPPKSHIRIHAYKKMPLLSHLPLMRSVGKE